MILFNFSLFTFTINGINIIGITEQINSFLEFVTLYIIILDINKIIYMLAIHELEEIEIGDLAFYETTREEKLIKGKEATNYILKDFLGKDEISALLDEYNERKTDEALFAYHCDKLECDIQMKLYDQEGCFDLNNQPNNPIINNPSVRKVLDSEKSISNAWIEFDRSKYEDDKNFIDIIEYLKENKI